ncbi:MAG: hypothetical protein M1816_001883 [Peltula sp. TS41687]|nr:MAG: hypothetical protein M1816_001883 [Peltula sp. TS41687]
MTAAVVADATSPSTFSTTTSTSTSTLLSTLTHSLSSTLSSLPSSSATDLQPPADGISLLDVKNELFLSYLQHLVFLILLKLRNARRSSASASASASADADADADAAEDEDDRGEEAGEEGEEAAGSRTRMRKLDEKTVKRLVEIRVFLEKGVRPLEGRLKYQLDKVLRAADDTGGRMMRVEAEAEAGKDEGDGDGDGKKKKKKKKKKKGKMESRVERNNSSSSSSSDGSEDEEDTSSDNGEEIEEEENHPTTENPIGTTVPIDDLSHRPNPSSLLRLRPSEPSSTTTTTSTSKTKPSIYRPPRIQPTSLAATTTTVPTVTSAKTPGGGGKAAPRKSATLDEFVVTELSSAPVAEPSIGSTIVSGGRRSKTVRERAVEAERQRYEEANFVRLPGENLKKKKGKQGRKDGGYGGEEWRGLDRGVDRIERLTARRKGTRSGSALLVERGGEKRKRALDSAAVERQGDGGFGERLEKKRRLLGRRKRTKGGIP